MNGLPPSNRHNPSLGRNSGVNFPSLSGNVYHFADPGLAWLGQVAGNIGEAGRLWQAEKEGAKEKGKPPPPRRAGEPVDLVVKAPVN